MSSTAKTQQRKLELRNVKKKLFKKKGAPSKNVVAVSSKNVIGQVKDEATTKKPVVLTREDLEVLRLFDHNEYYGPCVGITRRERWNRAIENQLDPPQKIENILSQHPDNPEVQECVWSKYNL